MWCAHASMEGRALQVAQTALDAGRPSTITHHADGAADSQSDADELLQRPRLQVEHHRNHRREHRDLCTQQHAMSLLIHVYCILATRLHAKPSDTSRMCLLASD